MASKQLANGSTKEHKAVPSIIKQHTPGLFMPGEFNIKDEKVIQAVVMSPHSSISNDASQMVDLAARLASATNAFNTDVATTISYIKDELKKLSEYETRVRKWHDEELLAMDERHKEDREHLAKVQKDEQEAHVRASENSYLLITNLRATLDGLLAKFSKPNVEPKE